MTLRPIYALMTLLVFAIEAAIALFVHDNLVRPYVGDVLAVALVYLGLRSVTPLPVAPAAISASVIAAIIELAQLFHLLTALGLDHNRLARVVLGGVFDGQDFVAYAVGTAAVVAIEAARKQRMT